MFLVIFLLCPAIVMVLCTYFPPLLSRVTMCMLSSKASDTEDSGENPDASVVDNVNRNNEKMGIYRGYISRPFT